MRASDFLNETQELDEIERLRPSDYEGGKQSLYDKQVGKQIKKLPGGSGLFYSTSEGRYGGIDIKLWDPNGKDFLAQKERGSQPKPVRDRREPVYQYERRVWEWQRSQRDLNTPGQLIGKLSVSDAKYFPLKGAVQVDTITVDEDYRGVGLARALYGIVLTILKRPLLAGSSQTPGGRRNWLSLASIPGVEMKGYFSMDESELDQTTSRYNGVTPAQANKNIDIIMGQLGGQHMGKGRHGDEYFAFDVQPDTSKQELKAYVDTKLSKVYGGYNSETGLYAVWTGQ
jgi:GNAT superfamily N-acetyltransferase